MYLPNVLLDAVVVKIARQKQCKIQKIRNKSKGSKYWVRAA